MVFAPVTPSVAPKVVEGRTRTLRRPSPDPSPHHGFAPSPGVVDQVALSNRGAGGRRWRRVRQAPGSGHQLRRAAGELDAAFNTVR